MTLLFMLLLLLWVAGTLLTQIVRGGYEAHERQGVVCLWMTFFFGHKVWTRHQHYSNTTLWDCARCGVWGNDRG